MKRLAILTDGSAPVAEEMKRILNEGNRYRVGNVPESLAKGTPEDLALALKQEGVDLLLVEDYSRELPTDFPCPVMKVDGKESAEEAIRDLMSRYPDYGPERKWAGVLKEDFDESRAGAEREREPEQPAAPAYSQQYFRPRNENPYNPYPNTEMRTKMPDNCMLWAILSVIFFSFIPGLVALFFSMRVSSKYYAGDYEGAEKSSRLAQIWIIVSIVLGCISATFYLPMMLISNMG